MITTQTTYQNTVRDLPGTLERVANEPFAKRESDYYLANISSVKSIDDFLADTRLFTYAMKAHGLGEMSYAKALVREVLEGGVEDSDAFVNRIADQRYRELATTFNFDSFDAATTSFSKAQTGVVEKYVRQQLEETAGSANEGVRLALYFERKASSIDSVEAILTDSALSTVVRTALQIPQTTAVLDIDKQVALIGEKLDLDQFSSPSGVEKFVNRFLNLWDATNPTSSPTSLLFGASGGVGLSSDLLIAIQSLR